MVSSEVIQVLADLLNDEHLEVDLRVAAAEGLGFTGFSSGRAALMQALGNIDTQPKVRVAAIRALGQTVHTAKR
jgi:HEAT repeat protein